MKKVQKFSETFLTYCCKEASKMSDDEIKATARLFSENYGEWSGHGRKPGCPIQFSPNMIKASFVDKPDRFVALVYYNNVLIGHAFYLRRHISQKGKLTWILQLVVDKKYRGYSIGTKLMHSIYRL